MDDGTITNVIAAVRQGGLAQASRWLLQLTPRCRRRAIRCTFFFRPTSASSRGRRWYAPTTAHAAMPAATCRCPRPCWPPFGIWSSATSAACGARGRRRRAASRDAPRCGCLSWYHRPPRRHRRPPRPRLRRRRASCPSRTGSAERCRQSSAPATCAVRAPRRRAHRQCRLGWALTACGRPTRPLSALPSVTGRGRGDAGNAAEPVVALFQEALCGMLARRYVRRGYQPLGRYLLVPSSVPDAQDATRYVRLPRHGCQPQRMRRLNWPLPAPSLCSRARWRARSMLACRLDTTLTGSLVLVRCVTVRLWVQPFPAATWTGQEVDGSVPSAADCATKNCAHHSVPPHPCLPSELGPQACWHRWER